MWLAWPTLHPCKHQHPGQPLLQNGWIVSRPLASDWKSPNHYLSSGGTHSQEVKIAYWRRKWVNSVIQMYVLCRKKIEKKLQMAKNPLAPPHKIQDGWIGSYYRVVSQGRHDANSKGLRTAKRHEGRSEKLLHRDDVGCTNPLCLPKRRWKAKPNRETRWNQMKPDETRWNQMKPDETRWNQMKPDETRWNQKQYVNMS